MAEKKINMPQSTAGLVRYYEEAQNAIKVKPEHVAAACVLLIVGVLALRFLV